jgi:hypothetical protein
VVHGETLRREGHTIWLNPNARATHAPPSGLSHFFWRFLLIGHDYYWQKKLIAYSQSCTDGSDLVPAPIPSLEDRDPTASSLGEKLKIFRDRMTRLLQNNPRHAIYFPFAIPIILVAAFLIYTGYLMTRVSPSYLIKTYDRILA